LHQDVDNLSYLINGPTQSFGIFGSNLVAPLSHGFQANGGGAFSHQDLDNAVADPVAWGTGGGAGIAS